MTISINNNNDGNTLKERRNKERRAETNRRAVVRFRDALGRRSGLDRREQVCIKSG